MAVEKRHHPPIDRFPINLTFTVLFNVTLGWIFLKKYKVTFCLKGNMTLEHLE